LMDGWVACSRGLKLGHGVGRCPGGGGSESRSSRQASMSPRRWFGGLVGSMALRSMPQAESYRPASGIQGRGPPLLPGTRSEIVRSLSGSTCPLSCHGRSYLVRSWSAESAFALSLVEGPDWSGCLFLTSSIVLDCHSLGPLLGVLGRGANSGVGCSRNDQYLAGGPDVRSGGPS
jgi:hypothetical protein